MRDLASPLRTAGAARDILLTALADRQWGLVRHAQLLELGFDQGAITRRLASRRLQLIHPRVYAVGHMALRVEGRLLAAVWACGRRAVLSYRSAGKIWEIRASDRALIDVTACTTGRRPPRGVDLHVTRRLRADEMTIRDGIPVTTVARTLADLAAVLRPGDLARAVERADALALLDANATVASAAGRPGARALRAALAGHLAPAPLRSELEQRLLSLIRRFGLGDPESNATLHGYEVDLLWRRERLVVEADGRAFHVARAAFERDRARDARLATHGFRVLRFSWAQVTGRPAEVTSAIAAALSTR